MTPKEKLLKEIEKIVSEMPEDKVKRVYQFVLHIAKWNRIKADCLVRWSAFLFAFPRPICSPYPPTSPIGQRII